MNFLQKISPEWPLRLGLGLMYLYSASDLFYHPYSWAWAVPSWFSDFLQPIMSIETYLRIQGFGEFVLALLFLAWFSGRRGVRAAAIIATLEMGAILIFTGIDPITFRDLGILGASSALVILVFRDIEFLPKVSVSSQNTDGIRRI